MRSFVHRSYLAFVFVFFSFAVFAQEKTQAYYNTHENEILPDANAAFGEGNYERTIQLCTWHYVFFGTRDAESLQKKAEQCAQLAKDMDALYAEGKRDEALEAANSLLSINPDDPKAKSIHEELTIVETPLAIEEIPEAPIEDTIAIVVPPQDNELVENIVQEPNLTVEQDNTYNPVPSTPEASGSLDDADISSPRIVLKAGVSILDMQQFAQTIAPGLNAGVYDLGGSRIGAEMGFYICPGIPSTSLFGVDADIVFRVADGLYPKAGIGFFSCKSTEGERSVTNGLCAGVGFTFVSGMHFCLEIGAKYYPVVKLRESIMVSTAGSAYEFPSPRQALPGGIVPMVGIGWAF